MPKAIITEELIQAHLQTLADTPRRIRANTEGLSEDQLRAKPDPKEWSAVRILAHLRGCADVWSYSIYAMLVLDSPAMAHIRPREWTKRQGYARLSFAENLQAFEVGRANLLRILEPLRFEDWERDSSLVRMHNTHTIFSQAQRLALHEAQHCDQIEAICSS